MERLFLGIDGGGTKTEAALGNERGQILASRSGGPSSPAVVELQGAVRQILLTARSVLRTRPRSELTWTVVGLASVDSEKQRRTVERTLRRRWRRYGGGLTVLNDILPAFAAGITGPTGAVIIAGTGSHAYAQGPKGAFHAGGLGPVLSDEGSGYEQGMFALRAAVRAADGRGPRTRLTAVIRRALAVPEIRALTDRPEILDDKNHIAALAPLIERAAKRGDRVARDILRDTAVRAAELLQAVATRAGLGGRFSVVEVGGLFRAPFYRAVFRRSVKHILPSARCVRLRQPPVIGALALARRQGRFR